MDPATLNVKNGPTDAWTGSRVFAAGDVAGANAVAPGGLLSTGLAMGCAVFKPGRGDGVDAHQAGLQTGW